MPECQPIVKAFSRLYGPNLYYYPSAPYEGTPLYTVELALHEMAHAIQIPAVSIEVGAMAPVSNAFGRYLHESPAADADTHEAGAIAITMLVLDRLELPVLESELIYAGARNCRQIYGQLDLFEHLVRAAKVTAESIHAARKIVELVTHALSSEAA